MLLTEKEIITKLSLLPHWSKKEDKIYRKLVFPSFKKSVQFFNALSLISEELNHHPEFFNAYRTCEIWMTTHDLGGITHLDFEFAHRVELWLEINSNV
jgi:4a-hydroxytetrahydrobiopterin dehydratase